MKTLSFSLTILMLIVVPLWSQQPYRVGTTTANFLEIGYGSAGAALGDAYASLATDVSAAYWNPAGLAFMRKHEAQFTYQPWLVDINSAFVGVGLVLPRIGTLALSLTQVGYGEMQVTTMEMQDGTGESFSPVDFAFGLSYGRQLAQWFSFGATAKYISSKIWHMNASAMAVDLGVMVNTQFFAFSGRREDGLTIGMSISNYGTKMKYDGMDLLNPIDILPNENGNYRDVPGQFKLEGWELPLIFRVGASLSPIVSDHHRLTLALDALHPNNNSESVNLGAEYALIFPTTGTFFLRAGYKGLAMSESEYGLTFGGGVHLRMMNNLGIKVDYAFRNMGILGNTHCYTVGVLF